MRDIELDTLLGHAHLHVMYWDSKEAPHKIIKVIREGCEHQSPASGWNFAKWEKWSRNIILSNYLLDNI